MALVKKFEEEKDLKRPELQKPNQKKRVKHFLQRQRFLPIYKKQ